MLRVYISTKRVLSCLEDLLRTRWLVSFIPTPMLHMIVLSVELLKAPAPGTLHYYLLGDIATPRDPTLSLSGTCIFLLLVNVCYHCVHLIPE